MEDFQLPLSYQSGELSLDGIQELMTLLRSSTLYMRVVLNSSTYLRLVDGGDEIWSEAVLSLK